MPEKKPYSAPQLTRVELNHEQAILSACSTTTTSTNSANGTGGCKGTAPPCKHAPGAGDNGARPS